ncbi:hypothetical protein OIE66_09315 [Nonomuraea sp. NBC_01738]|uniref:hypothetical protein n=1 Tax=Nonomuraea sp. NBC_01738 TaxID=2976003 RepID=UPI002E148D4A|nr:hypothetical protein OIE66_09315 [Nonomuraea sp. NBC_01738]
MHHEEPRRSYPHPYPSDPAPGSPENFPWDPTPLAAPTWRSPDETPTAGMPALSAASARTVHRLRHIRQVSDLAIDVIDQALRRAS